MSTFATRAIAAILLILAAMMPALAFAHPMGNFSINHYARIEPGRNSLELRYLIDMAEIPTFQEIQRTSITPKEADLSVIAYLPGEARALAANLTLMVDGKAAPLKLISSNAIFPPGAGGLPTMKMGFLFRAALSDSASNGLVNRIVTINYRDTNFPDRAGWKEVVVTPREGVSIASSSAPEKDRSDELSNYPTDLLHSPPQMLDAEISFTTGAAIAARSDDATAASAAAVAHLAMRANAQGTPRSAFTELITSPRHSLWFLLTAALIAAGLGALHALEPGHGKTLVAAYLVGSRSNFRHVIVLGTIVTSSHTAAVYILGITTLYASRWILPDRLYPWLGLASGLLVAGVGLVMLMRRFETAADTHSHSHLHGEAHTHTYSHSHSHPHSHDDVSVHDHGATSMRELFALGVTGGIVPCPAALVVLLSAIAIRRVAFGLFLIVAFSFGLAAVLICFGLAMVYARRYMSRFKSDGPLISRWLPMLSSAVITMVGMTMAVTSLMSAGLLRINL